VQKRRSHAKNYSPRQTYFHTHEHFLTGTKSTHDSKGRSFKQSYSSSKSFSKEFQQKDGYSDNTLCLKKDPFDSLESLFDLKKPLNLRDVFPLAFHYYKQKLIKTSNTTKSEPLLETLFLPSVSSQTNLQPFVFKAVIMLLLQYSIYFHSSVIRLITYLYIFVTNFCIIQSIY